MIDVVEELARRELNDIVERRGLRDDETAVRQLIRDVVSDQDKI